MGTACLASSASLQEQRFTFRREGLEGKKVLVTPCLVTPPSFLPSQDFNAQVLRELTIPNVNANLAKTGRGRPTTRWALGHREVSL